MSLVPKRDSWQPHATIAESGYPNFAAHGLPCCARSSTNFCFSGLRNFQPAGFTSRIKDLQVSVPAFAATVTSVAFRPVISHLRCWRPPVNTGANPRDNHFEPGNDEHCADSGPCE